MTSYLILTPPTGPGKDHEATRCLRDGFSLAAFLLPGLWLLWHRLWLLAIGTFLIEGIAIAMVRMPGLWPAGFVILLGVRVLAATEGRMAYIRGLLHAGWTEDGLVSAHDLWEAEEIHFSKLPEPDEKDISPAHWNIPAKVEGYSAPGKTALGLIGYDGGRAWCV